MTPSPRGRRQRTPVRLMLDEMFSSTLAAPLRAAGCDVYVVVEHEDRRRASDPEVLELAAAASRILVTLNTADFWPLDVRWAAEGRRHGGILYVSGKTFPASKTQTGLVASALMRRLEHNDWPAAGSSDFLGRR